MPKLIEKPRVQRAFCEAVQIFSAVRAQTPTDFAGLEWCLSDGQSLTPMGRAIRGLWQDLEGGSRGEMLLHGLPSEKHILVRVLYEGAADAARSSAWIPVETRPMPSVCSSHHRYDIMGRERGGIPGVCCGWVLMEDTSNPIVSSEKHSRCQRCGDLAESHPLCGEAAQRTPAQLSVKKADAEQYIVTIKPCVSAFTVPDINSTVVHTFHTGEYVWLFEWDESKKWRRCICEGDLDDPRKLGWVMVLTVKYGPLLIPQNQERMRNLCQNDPHGVMSLVMDDIEEGRREFLEQKELMSEINSRLVDKRAAWRARTLSEARFIPRGGPVSRLDLGDGRLLLGPQPRASSSRRIFQQALVMGAHHTCTTALAHELVQQFHVEVVNDYNGIVSPELRPENYKHRVLCSPPVPEDALAICLIKDPFFWLQSLSRYGAIYAIKPVRGDPETGEFHDRDLQTNQGICDLAQDKLLDLLLSQVEFLGDVYEEGALGVWEATVRSYFDPVIYPLERTVVIRSEDFLFNFDAVMHALNDIGLQRRKYKPEPTTKPMKEGTMHPHTRGRPEALNWYGVEEHRFVGLRPRHTNIVFDRLGPGALMPLRYGRGAVAKWVRHVADHRQAWDEAEVEELEEGPTARTTGQESQLGIWVIVGGEDKGGVLVREGYGLASRRCAERLSTGSLVQEIVLLESDVAGERLHYQKLSGTGPDEGWISVALNHKILAERVTPSCKMTSQEAMKDSSVSMPVEKTRVK